MKLSDKKILDAVHLGLMKAKQQWINAFFTIDEKKHTFEDFYSWVDISNIENKFHFSLKKGDVLKLRLCNECEWENLHQPWELKYHKKPNFRWDDVRWKNQWDKIFSEFMEIDPTYFTNESVLLDVGCGSRPCLDWFEKGITHHLDPLLDNYLEIDEVKPYWKNKTFLYSQPAESLVKSLVGKCDYIHCWNVLDHTYDWKQLLENIVHYSKKGGLVLLGTDIHSTPHLGHPGINNQDEFFSFINEHFKTIKGKNEYVARDVVLKLERK